MTEKEAANILRAKQKCVTRVDGSDYDCNHRLCADCISRPPVTSQPKTDILDKIKQDIFNACCDIYHMPVYNLDYVQIFEIIDRYKTESEDKK